MFTLPMDALFNPPAPLALQGMTVLWVCAAALAVLSATQHTYRGFVLWVAATAALAAALACQAWAPGDGAANGLAWLLRGTWPLLTLAGLRRFHARVALHGSERQDAAGVLVYALALGASALPAAPAWGQPAALAALHLLCAAVLWAAPTGEERRALRLLGAVLAAVGLGPLLLGALDGGSSAATEMAAIGLQVSGGTAVAFMALMLTCQRTERELRRSRRRLRTLANIDMLTQVPNRRRFLELAQRALATDAGGSACLLMLDIDHFKQINDSLGHAAGDRALRLVSRCTLELLRSQDVAGRHGGDEFVLLLRHTRAADAMAVAQRIVAQLQLHAPAQQLPRLSLSFGIVQMGADESVEDAMMRADQALYEAKRQGRSRAVAAEGEADAPVFRNSQRLGLQPL